MLNQFVMGFDLVLYLRKLPILLLHLNFGLFIIVIKFISLRTLAPLVLGRTRLLLLPCRLMTHRLLDSLSIM